MHYYVLLLLLRGNNATLASCSLAAYSVFKFAALADMEYRVKILNPKTTFLRVILSVIQRCYLSIARQYSKGEIESTGDKHSSNFWRETQRHSLYYMVSQGRYSSSKFYGGQD